MAYALADASVACRSRHLHSPSYYDVDTRDQVPPTTLDAHERATCTFMLSFPCVALHADACELARSRAEAVMVFIAQGPKIFTQ